MMEIKPTDTTLAVRSCPHFTHTSKLTRLFDSERERAHDRPSDFVYRTLIHQRLRLGDYLKSEGRKTSLRTEGLNMNI